MKIAFSTFFGFGITKRKFSLKKKVLQPIMSSQDEKKGNSDKKYQK